MHSVVTSRTAAVLLTVAALTAMLVGCSPGGKPSGGPAPSDGSPLASALGLVPQMPHGYAMFTDWSMLGHGEKVDATTAMFADQLRAFDDVLEKDLGIRSVNADWELQVWQPGGPPTAVFHYGAQTDLSALPGKLTHFGYDFRDRFMSNALGADICL